MKINKELAECIGLWLAEGDNKSKNELTFTNNCWELVGHFHKTLLAYFLPQDQKIRIYIYDSNKNKSKIPLKNIQVNHYIDKSSDGGPPLNR